MNATPVRPVVFEFCTVNVSGVVPFNGMLAAPNALLMVGALVAVMMRLGPMRAKNCVPLRVPSSFCPGHGDEQRLVISREP